MFFLCNNLNNIESNRKCIHITLAQNADYSTSNTHDVAIDRASESYILLYLPVLLITTYITNVDLGGLVVLKHTHNVPRVVS